MRLMWLVVWAGFACAAGAWEPNEPDAHTLHLWHLDEDGPPFADRGLEPHPLLGMHNGATAGRPAAPGLGRAVTLKENVGGTPCSSDLRGAIVTLARTLENGPGDNAPPSFRFFGSTGAFTYEALVKFDILPQEAEVIAATVLSMDGDSDDRMFNFRIEKAGFLTFIVLPASGTSGGGLASIPTEGPHAINTRDWFHVAVTYDGNPGSPNNLRLYWTRLMPGLREANLIGRGSLSANFSDTRGDFAIGNEARAFEGNAEGEPFPGSIDEVRISAVARHPSDFFFIPPGHRRGGYNGDPGAPAAGQPGKFELKLAGVWVDDKPHPLPDDGPLVLEPGLHRLDFDFGFLQESIAEPLKLRCQLAGVDERWQETGRGMALHCEILDEAGAVLSQTTFPANGTSRGWDTAVEDSELLPRREPIFVPEGGRRLRVTLNSGTPYTTGSFVIDDLALTVPGEPDAATWPNGGFSTGETLDSPGGTPDGWSRIGPDPAIARMASNRKSGSEQPDHALALVDTSQATSGGWTSTRTLPPLPTGGRTLILSWREAFNIIGGSMQRATYVNVPPGNYVFRAVGITAAGEPASADLALAVVIPPPFWQEPWFHAVVAGGTVFILAAGIVLVLRRRARRRIEMLRLQNALESDRTRIARDMHDDLGTRVTVLTMAAALVERDIKRDPEKAGRHLGKLSASARELVTAMDNLVWAVDPSNDTLDHLGAHIAKTSQELFRDTPVRFRTRIPAQLPPVPLHSDFRHHVSLAVREALHNILRHAGPCEATLELETRNRELVIRIEDHGSGFDPASVERGHGLDNLRARMADLGGTCEFSQAEGGGTRVVLACPLPTRTQALR